jgi:pilus assembly protein CpaB
MRLTRQAALAIALVCGLLAAILAWVWVGQQNKPAVKAPETVEVPVPVKTIPAQVDLMPAMFKKAVIAEKGKIPTNAVLSDQDLIGRVSLSELPAGQPVRADQIAIRSKQLGMAYSLAPGQRALSLSVDQIEAVADFVQPGNHVDLLVSFSRGGQFLVRTLVQDVLVLAMGSATNAPAPPPPPAATGTAAGAAPEKPAEKAPPKRPEIPCTLSVTPNQAQLIFLADVSGDIRFTLRPMGEKSVVPMAPSNSWSLIGTIPGSATTTGGPTPPAPTPAAQPPPQYYGPPGALNFGASPTSPPRPAPRRPSVEIIRGGQREIVTPGQ